MKRSLKNVIMGVMLVIVLLLTIVTVYKATNERVVIGTGMAGDPNGMGGNPDGSGPDGATMVDGNLVFPNGTIIYPDRTGVNKDGIPLTQEEIDEIMPAGPGGAAPDAAPGGMGGGPMTETTINPLDKIYYVYFGVESLVFLLILAYLLLSKFNKKDFSETFDDKLKFILLAIIAIFGTAILTYACTFISDIVANKMAESSTTDNNTEGTGMETTNPENTTDTEQGSMGNETTDPNAGTIPEGGENIAPEQNQNDMDSVPGTPVMPNGDVGQNTVPDQGQPSEQPGNPAAGGQTPPQMP